MAAPVSLVTGLGRRNTLYPTRVGGFNQHTIEKPFQFLFSQIHLMTQCEVIESDSSWEDVENEQDLYPTFDVNSETWAEELTNSIRRFHGETIEPMLDNSESNT